MIITESHLKELPSIYEALGGKTHKNIALAARRLAQTSFRDEDDDILLDACIGIEALLGEGRDELTHRMGLRAATALAHLPLGPTTTYEALKKAYSQRSKIVHGGTPNSDSMAFPSGNDQVLVSSVATQLLAALLRAHIRASPPWTPKDLDIQMLDALDRRRAVD